MSSQDEVEEFAALLRRLKARTDRSYAALARRLDMNASTLHRYCAGEVVPLSFASVERFAAMCGAGPAERIELHRRWVLAVAARQRSRTVTESVPDAAGARSVDGEEPPADGADGVDGADRVAGADGVDGADGVAEPVPAVAADSVFTTAAASVPAAGAGASSSVSAAPAAAPREAPGESHPGSSRQHEAVSRPAPGRPWYRRRLAVTVAVVTALVAALGSLSALPSGPSSAARDGQASGTAGARTAGAVPDSPAPSAPATSGPAAPPLTWTVNSQLWATGCDHDYVIDKEPQQVPPPPAPQDAAPWARSQGAVHGGQTIVDISVQGLTDDAVVLEALRVRVVGRAAPVKGIVYATGQGCGGDMDPRSFTVDLDIDRPIARPAQGVAGGTSTPAIRMPLRVSSKDPEVLLVDARTVGCDCRWYLELDWSSLGRTGTERIDDQGVPFRTSGTKDLPHYWYPGGAWTPTG
ncbi:helix-turn-helix domain-containing protein [Kitasatospora sp. NBC_00240]|uniref:helix-turn-helix domain-containing protein n=1 Tax=Kitasatospora sp. NBC_00240 TaxID=2903567 RepID=UPI00224CA778|nr:helix-turn-helix transcriptional regulator [Kitasatospora sp. NBC_00240]MCX5215200.1 helix-turn-helix domain-containing protein [Kitasatospora sp. NBC_00240]